MSFVKMVEVWRGALVESGQVDRVAGRARLVVEATAALAGGFELAVIAQRGVSWRWAPRTVQPCGAG